MPYWLWRWPFIYFCRQKISRLFLRVVCRGGRLPFAERTLVPSEIRLWQSPVLKMLQSDLYNVQLIDGKRKYSYPWLSISGERLAFLNDRYRVEIKNDWRGMFG